MSKLKDPTICPDCRADLDTDGTCTACGLRLKGPLARELWQVMLIADGLVERMRTPAAKPVPSDSLSAGAMSGKASGGGTGVASAAATGVVSGPSGPSSLPHHPPLTPMPRTQGAARHPRLLPAASVPAVLLSLGALCLLVAAAVFIAVTWDVLGLAGRTMVLLVVTTALAAVAVLLSRKGLRAAAETFWVVVAGMLGFDLLGAWDANLLGLGDLTWRGTGALVGLALLVLGLSVGTWSRSQPVTRSYAGETIAVLGATVVCVVQAWGAPDPAVPTALAVPVLAALTVVVRRPLSVAAYGLGGLCLVSWLVLLGQGWDRAAETTTMTAWWAEFRGWPLLAAAVWAAVAALPPQVPERARQAAAALALFPLVLLANAPATVASPTRDLMIGCATVLALALVATVAPAAWARAAAGLTAGGMLLLGAWLLAAPGSSLGRLYLGSQPEAAAWAALVVALTLVVAAVGVLRQVPLAWRADASSVVQTLAPAILALGGLVLLLELGPPRWAAVLGALVAAGVAGGAAWWSRGKPLAGALGSLAAAYLAGLALLAAAGNDGLLAGATTVLFLVVAAVCGVREREGGRISAAVAGGAAGFLGGGAVVTWGRLLGADGDAQVVVLAVYAALVGLAAAPLTLRATTRTALEAVAVTLAVIAIGVSADQRTQAMVLTIVGTAACLVVLTTRDRALLGWGGAGLLGLATFARVLAGVTAPELYTLPAAALLIGCGLWRLRHDLDASSFTVLGSGITLALLPSLLLALDEPVSLRGALIGAGGVLVLGLGVQQRLAAPFVLGALTTASLALRHLGPMAEAVPRWVSLGGLGLALLVVGVTWEARRRDAEKAQRYLTSLR